MGTSREMVGLLGKLLVEYLFPNLALEYLFVYK
jgi:hypothetical protein